MRQMNGLNSGFFLYARKEMRQNLAFNTRNAQFFLLLRPGRGPNNHTRAAVFYLLFFRQMPPKPASLCAK